MQAAKCEKARPDLETSIMPGVDVASIARQEIDNFRIRSHLYPSIQPKKKRRKKERKKEKQLTRKFIS